MGNAVIKGKITDDAGEAVAGAHVEIVLLCGKETERNACAKSFHRSVTTGPDGNWLCDEIPQPFDRAMIGVWDRRYANGDGYAMRQVSTSSLVDGSHLLVLMRGVQINGEVLDPDGKPIEGASVVTATHMCSNQMPPLATDARGRFSHVAIPGEMVTLTITHLGRAPELMQFVMGNDPKNVTVVLSKAATIRGRVIGPNGEAVAGAWIYANTWRGSRSLRAQMQCDASGEFVWDQAPRDVVYCDIDGTQQGYVRESGVALKAGDQPLTITLGKPVEIHGTVVDAHTGGPVDQFTIMPGFSEADQQPMFWHASTFREGSGGAFSLRDDFGFGHPVSAVRIVAPGFMPEISRQIAPGEHRIDLRFDMRRGADLILVLLAPDGRPAIGARAMLATPGQSITVRNCGEISEHGCPESIADVNGQITFPPQSEPFKLLVLGDDGYLLLDHDAMPESNRLTLAAWAKVDGVVIMAGKPGPDQRVVAHPRGEPPQSQRPRVHLSFNTRTDLNGRFCFDRIPPGSVTLARETIQPRPGGGGLGQWKQRQIITLNPGEHAHVQIGGTGRTIVGSLVIPPELANAKQHWISGIESRFHTRDSGPPWPEMPDDIRNGTEEQRRQWSQAFMKSESGLAFRAGLKKDQESRRYYAVEIQPDGTFRVEVVSSGVYKLQVFVKKNRGARVRGETDAIVASGVAEIDVPEMPGGRSDEPLIVPNVALAMHDSAGDAG